MPQLRDSYLHTQPISDRMPAAFQMVRQMLDELDIIAYTFDKDRKVLYANKLARKTLRMKEGEDTYIGAGEKDHFEHNKYFDEEGNELTLTSESLVTRAFRGGETRNLVLEHRNLKNSTHAWVEVNCLPVMDEEGRFAYGILMYRDISQRKARLNKLEFLLKAMSILSLTSDFEKRLEEKTKLLVPALADWCALDVVDATGSSRRIALTHRDPEKMEWLREYNRTQLIPSGESPAEAIVRTGKPIIAPRITEASLEHSTLFTEKQREAVRKLDLSSVLILPIGEPGRVLGVLSIAYAESKRTYSPEDIKFFQEFCSHLSVLLENERLYNEIRARDKAKDAFLAALSHELRNPLAPIKSSLELIRMQNKDRTLDHDIGIIEHQFDHIANLLKDLLDATRFTRGMVHIERATFDIRDVVEAVARARQTVAEGCGINLRVDLCPAALLVKADRTRIEQAVSNLVSNAIKFTSKGGVVTITAAEEDDMIAVRVKDTGAGVTPEELPHVFDLYYRSDRLKRLSSGLGVGLGLVYEIAELHGGSVRAVSDGEGKGSEFALILPRA